jgi:hypothetical protein
MININSFSLLVRKGIILDSMNNTAKYKDEPKQLEPLTVEKVRYKKSVICPCCSHSFNPRKHYENNIKNKNSDIINDASCNTTVKVKSKKDGCNN